MRLILFIFLIVNLLGAKDCKAQGPGTFQWTNGAPNNNPGLSGAKFAVDKNTYRWYEWVSGTSWVESGDRIQRISGCSAPNYTPTIHQSHVVINGCTSPSIPEIYAWMGSAWVKLNPSSTTYTAGTGIAISGGNVISADTSLLATQYDISQLGIAFPLLAPNSGTPTYGFITGGGIYKNADIVTLESGATLAGSNNLTIKTNDGDVAGSVRITGGTSGGESGEGGGITLRAGGGSEIDFGFGGGVIMQGGDGYYGGSAGLRGGAGIETAGEAFILGGYSESSKGGAISAQGGTSNTGAGGDVFFFGGESSEGDGGDLFFNAGETFGATARSGNIIFATKDATSLLGGSMEFNTGSGINRPAIFNTAGIQYKALTTTQRNALTGLTEGRLLWNSTTKHFNLHDGTSYYEIPKIIKASATLDFPSTGAHSSSDLTTTVTGAAVGDVVTVAPGIAAILAGSNYTAWVSATNTVTVRFNHYGSGGGSNPSSATFNIIVTKF